MSRKPPRSVGRPARRRRAEETVEHPAGGEEDEGEPVGGRGHRNGAGEAEDRPAAVSASGRHARPARRRPAQSGRIDERSPETVEHGARLPPPD